MKKMKDANSNMDTALQWAISAKNALLNHAGYSPYQFVFENKVNIPSVIPDLSPAVESTTSSDTVRINLNAIHNARQNFNIESGE